MTMNKLTIHALLVAALLMAWHHWLIRQAGKCTITGSMAARMDGGRRTRFTS